MSASYGQDLSLVQGFPQLFPTLEGSALVLQAVYRRWTTPPDTEAGRRIYGSQCRDIRQLMAMRFDGAILAGWESDLAEIARHDDRVDACTVTLTGSKSTKTLTLTALITVGQVTSTLVIPFDTFEPEILDAVLP